MNVFFQPFCHTWHGVTYAERYFHVSTDIHNASIGCIWPMSVKCSVWASSSFLYEPTFSGFNFSSVDQSVKCCRTVSSWIRSAWAIALFFQPSLFTGGCRVGRRIFPGSLSQNGAWTSRLTPLPLGKRTHHSNFPVCKQVRLSFCNIFQKWVKS